MPAFDPTLAEIRFGCGLSPEIAPAQSPAAMLATLQGPDLAAARHPIEPFDSFRARIVLYNQQGRLRKDSRGTAAEKTALKAMRVMNKQARQRR